MELLVVITESCAGWLMVPKDVVEETMCQNRPASISRIVKNNTVSEFYW